MKGSKMIAALVTVFLLPMVSMGQNANSGDIRNPVVIGKPIPTTSQIVVHDDLYTFMSARYVYHLYGVNNKEVARLNCGGEGFFLDDFAHQYILNSKDECDAILNLLARSIPQHNVIFTLYDDAQGHFRVTSVMPQ